jgi:hypothetical protein
VTGCGHSSPSRTAAAPGRARDTAGDAAMAHGSMSLAPRNGCSASRNGYSASRRGLRVTICPSRAVAIGSGLVAMIGTSRLGDITAGPGSQIPADNPSYGVKARHCCVLPWWEGADEAQSRCSFSNRRRTVRNWKGNLSESPQALRLGA